MNALVRVAVNGLHLQSEAYGLIQVHVNDPQSEEHAITLGHQGAVGHEKCCLDSVNNENMLVNVHDKNKLASEKGHITSTYKLWLWA